jgi:hypothetical protein
MLTYPEYSSEYDLRYANDYIPIVSILNNGRPVDSNMYMSKKDIDYIAPIKEKLPMFINRKVNLRTV